MMNCDQAFEAMTSAFEHDHSSSELSVHLSCCARCREMADVLSPVMNGLNSLRGDLEREVTAGGDTPEAGLILANRTARELTVRAEMRREESSLRSSRFRKTAAVMLVLLIGGIGGWGFGTMQSPNSSFDRKGAFISAEDCTWKSRDDVAESSPRTVTLTCVACHLPLERSQ